MNEANNNYDDGEEINDNTIVVPAVTNSGNDTPSLVFATEVAASATNIAMHDEYTTEQIGQLPAAAADYGGGRNNGGDGDAKAQNILDKPDSTRSSNNSIPAAKGVDINSSNNNNNNNIIGDGDRENNNISERERNILASIKHRRQLLTWIRNCQIETKAVLAEMLMAEEEEQKEENEEKEDNDDNSHKKDEQQKQNLQNKKRQHRGFINTMLSDYYSSSSQPQQSEQSQLLQNASMTTISSSSSFSTEVAELEMKNYQTITTLADRATMPQIKRVRINDATTNDDRGIRNSQSRSSSSGGRYGTKSINSNMMTDVDDNMNNSSNNDYAAHSSTIGKQFHKSTDKSNTTNNTNTNIKQKKSSRKRKSSTLLLSDNNNSSGTSSSSGGGGGGLQKNVSTNSSISTIAAVVPSLLAVNLLQQHEQLLTRLDSILHKQVQRQRIIKAEHDDDDDDDSVEQQPRIVTVPTTTMPSSTTAMVAAINDTDNCQYDNTIIHNGDPTLDDSTILPVSVVDSSSTTMTMTELPSYPKIQPLCIKKQQQQLTLPPPPPNLPLRRRTHWDCVLDEMKWLATDYHEERKWKMAVSKTVLSSAIREYHIKLSSSLTRATATNRAVSGAAAVITSTTTTIPTPTKRNEYMASGLSIASSSTSSSSRSTRRKLSKSIDTNTVIPTIGGNIIDDETDGPLYVNASIEDVENVKKVSYWLSMSIMDYWESNNTSSSSSEDIGQQLSQQRLNKLKMSFLSNMDDDDDDGNNESTNTEAGQVVVVQSSTNFNGQSHDRMIHHDTTTTNDTNEIDNRNQSSSRRSEMGYNEISLRMKLSLDNMKSIIMKIKQSTKEVAMTSQYYQQYNESITAASTIRDGVKLDDGQIHAVHMIECLWNCYTSHNNSVGGRSHGGDDTTTFLNGNSNNGINNNGDVDAVKKCRNISIIVSGGFGCGKTITVCALLWSYRNYGPQLIVCSTSALYRWRYELRKFVDLNVTMYAGGGCFDDMKCKASDVVLCHYDSLLELSGRRNHSSSTSQTSLDFASMILDLRHPCSTTPDSESIVNVKWWIALNRFVTTCSDDMKRLLIEHTDVPQSCILHTLSSTTEATRRDDELLAMKVAFIYHPAIFFSEQVSVGRKVISWAKCESKDQLTTDTSAHNKIVDLSSFRYRSVLVKSLKNICDPLVNVMRVDDDQVDWSDKFAWELHMCPLTKLQQDAYNKMISTVGGSDDEIVDGLIKMRKICIYSSIDQFVANLLAPIYCNGLKNQDSVYGTNIMRSSKKWLEPNIDIARNIMKKSSKMTRLLSVLINECGFDVASKIDLFETLDEEMVFDEGPKKNSKVLILATLVEAQLLTSYFLAAVGLHHEVLVSADVSPEGEHESAWTWSQDVISQFNNSCVGSKSLQVIISSPKTLSSHNVGVAAVSAGTVISIDEDWSGREASHIKSIISKLHRHELRASTELVSSSSNSPLKLVKLVCQDTCEETFIVDGCIQASVDGVEERSSDKGGVSNATVRVDKTALLPSKKRGRAQKKSLSLETAEVASPASSRQTQRTPVTNQTCNCANSRLSPVLFNTEDRICCLSVAITGQLPGVSLKLRSIVASKSNHAGNAIRRYINSFRKSSSYIPYGRYDKPSIVLDAISGDDRSSRDVSGTSVKKVATYDNNATLLIYRVPDKERRQRQGDGLYNECDNDLEHSIYLLGYSFFANNTMYGGSQGCEPVAYIPEFLSDLLADEGKLSHSKKRLSDNNPNCVKRVRISTVETNRHSNRDYRNEYGNTELSFHRGLLASDLSGATSCQHRTSLNSMIVITQTKKKLKSKCKSSGAGTIARPNPSLLVETSNVQNLSDSVYFKTEQLFTQMFPLREGIRFTITAASMGRIRFYSRLNDLVSNSFAMSLAASTQNNEVVLLGTLPRVDVEVVLPKREYLSQFAHGARSDLLPKETLRERERDNFGVPWSDQEDLALQHSVLRYGDNWHLASNAVSSGKTFWQAVFADGRDYMGRPKQRSAAQCQNRWKILDASKSQIQVSPSPQMSDTDINSLFVDQADDIWLKNQSKPESERYTFPIWIEKATDLPPPPPMSEAKRHEVLARVRRLNELSKQRIIPKEKPVTISDYVHPSHAEAIQAARASMLAMTNGIAPPRQDMWPLELLELREKHRQSLAKGSTHTHSQSTNQHLSAPYHSPPPHKNAGQMPASPPAENHAPQQKKNMTTLLHDSST